MRWNKNILKSPMLLGQEKNGPAPTSFSFQENNEEITNLFHTSVFALIKHKRYNLLISEL